MAWASSSLLPLKGDGMAAEMAACQCLTRGDEGSGMAIGMGHMAYASLSLSLLKGDSIAAEAAVCRCLARRIGHVAYASSLSSPLKGDGMAAEAAPAIIIIVITAAQKRWHCTC